MAKKLDYLATEILRMFKELGFDKGYIAEKESDFNGKDRFAMLLWCNNLDSNCLEQLAKNLGVNFDDFKVTIKTVRSL